MTIRFITMLTLGLFISACGSNSSGVPSNKTLDELDGSESEKLCEFTLDLMEEMTSSSSMKRGLCSLQGFMMEQTGFGTCEDVRDECMNTDIDFDDDFDEDFEDEAFCSSEGLDVPAGCDVTVGEFEDCLVAMRDTMLDAFADVTCDSLRAGEGENPFEEDGVDIFDFESVPECAALAERCEIFE